MGEFPNLPVCTVPLFCTTMTSISPERRWQRSSLQPTSMLKLSGLVSSPRLSKDATLEIWSATSDLPQQLVVLLQLPLQEMLLQLLGRRRRKRRKKNLNLAQTTTWDSVCSTKRHRNSLHADIGVVVFYCTYKAM